jgi:hypothetical protein
MRGRGFHQRNLWFMRNFYLAYPKVNALRSELSWTHYRLLLREEKQEACAFYEAEAACTIVKPTIIKCSPHAWG